jgi:hypothetical protein
MRVRVYDPEPEPGSEPLINVGTGTVFKFPGSANLYRTHIYCWKQCADPQVFFYVLDSHSSFDDSQPTQFFSTPKYLTKSLSSPVKPALWNSFLKNFGGKSKNPGFYVQTRFSLFPQSRTRAIPCLLVGLPSWLSRQLNISRNAGLKNFIHYYSCSAKKKQS